MKLLIARIVVVGIGLLLVLGRYGTLEPCAMLRAEVQRTVLAHVGEPRARSELDALATVHGMSTLHDLLAASTAGRSPSQCLVALARFHGDPELAALLGGERADATAAARAGDDRG